MRNALCHGGGSVRNALCHGDGPVRNALCVGGGSVRNALCHVVSRGACAQRLVLQGGWPCTTRVQRLVSPGPVKKSKTGRPRTSHMSSSFRSHPLHKFVCAKENFPTFLNLVNLAIWQP